MITNLLPQHRASVHALLLATSNFSDAELAVADELITVVLEEPDQKDYHAFVGVVGAGETESVAGFLLLGPTPATSGTWDLYWMATDPRHYGTGVAQALQLFAESLVQSFGGYLLIAETSSQDGYARARAFYHKAGYDELARIADYYKSGDDLVVFGKRL